MMIRVDRLGLAAAACAGALAYGAPPARAADDVTAWAGDARSAMRMVTGKQTTGEPLRAGVQIRMAPGWHTYWRYPGDSGVPPTVTFEGSSNVKHVEVLWPAPQRLVEEGGTSIGYRVGTIFPLRIVPQEPRKPVSLRLRLQYAICEKTCVPADGSGELTLPGPRASQDAALAAAEARVPRKIALGEAGELSIQSVRREQGPGKPQVVVDVAGPADVDLFAEGPTPHWALPVPSRITGAPAGIQRFAFELDGAPAGERYEGAWLTLTAVTPTDAIEVTTRLD
jgi:DsbC/DsbD-like thiol-disulfide interchange protein